LRSEDRAVLFIHVPADTICRILESA
jgi:hypothetical protein